MRVGACRSAGVAAICSDAPEVATPGHLLHARLFRLGAIRYSQRVHNIPEIQGAIEKCDLAILHHGYAETGDTAQARTDRRVTMCERWVAEEPENPSAWTYLAYARLETKDTLEQALDAANRALALHEAQGTPAARLPHAAFPLMAAAARLDRPDDVLRGALICTDAEPLHPDPFYFGALVFARLGRWRDAFNAAGRFLELQARARVRPKIFVGFENMTYSRIQEALSVLGTAIIWLEAGDQGVSNRHQLLVASPGPRSYATWPHLARGASALQGDVIEAACSRAQRLRARLVESQRLTRPRPRTERSFGGGSLWR